MQLERIPIARQSPDKSQQLADGRWYLPCQVPMKRMRTQLTILLLLATRAIAADSEYVAVIDNTTMRNVDARALGIDIGEMNYEAGPASVPATLRDLNLDGTEDLVVRGSLEYCGTGGCSLYIFDGKSRKKIGSVFGNPLIVHGQVINGWPVLSIYSHFSATSGTYSTYVHDGQQYVKASSVFLHSDSVNELFDGLRAINKQKTD